MATDLGSASEVRRIIGRSSNEITDADAEAYLNEAIRKIKSRHYNNYMEDYINANCITATGATNLVYETYFPIKSGTTTKVYVNGVLKTVTTDYAISSSTITFTSSANLVSGDRIVFVYTPEFFDDYANWLASEKLYITSLIDTSNAASQAVYENIKETARSYEKEASSKPHVAKWTDHREDYGIF